MKISHEVPISLLEASKSFNDYDYCLVHLYESNQIYRDFYRESIKLGREVLLDNSIFELGKAFESSKFIESVIDLQPTYFIIPDALEDLDQTIRQYSEWESLYRQFVPARCKSIGVVQGKTFRELLECYKFFVGKVDKIAISFDYSCYLPNFLIDKSLTWYAYMYGRFKFLYRLREEGLLCGQKLHLLGCSLPQEFSLYKDVFPEIESLDTSNPVVHGIFNIRYASTGLISKESIKLADLIQHNVTATELEVIMYNIETFRKLALF